MAACSSGGSGSKQLRVVASFYPLAWAAEKIAPDAKVTDLTPPGGEPHDLQLTARQRLEIQNASVVFTLGKGFQPEVERAAKDARGRVVDLLEGLDLLPSTEKGLQADPHVWLDPKLMVSIVGKIALIIQDIDPAGDDYVGRARNLDQAIEREYTSYFQTLSGCALKILVTTHEAFGYLAKRFGLTQLGLTGLTPEAEPSAAQIQHVRQIAGRGEVGAIFYEDSDEGRRIGRSVASDVGVPALPLHTLESDPAPLDYIGQMERNLPNLKRGLRCR
jgi:zinc transport system substrate-binding protein